MAWIGKVISYRCSNPNQLSDACDSISFRGNDQDQFGDRISYKNCDQNQFR